MVCKCILLTIRHCEAPKRDQSIERVEWTIINNSLTCPVEFQRYRKSQITYYWSSYGNLLDSSKSWRQHPTRHQLYGHLPPITKTIQVRWTRHAGHCWRSRDELIRDVLLWTPTYGWTKAGWLAWTYIQQLCEDTGCSSEDLPEAMNIREKWRERVRDIRATSTTWWWWWWWIKVCLPVSLC